MPNRRAVQWALVGWSWLEIMAVIIAVGAGQGRDSNGQDDSDRAQLGRLEAHR
jgi:hypothetical protein